MRDTYSFADAHSSVLILSSSSDHRRVSWKNPNNNWLQHSWTTHGLTRKLLLHQMSLWPTFRARVQQRLAKLVSAAHRYGLLFLCFHLFQYDKNVLIFFVCFLSLEAAGEESLCFGLETVSFLSFTGWEVSCLALKTQPTGLGTEIGARHRVEEKNLKMFWTTYRRTDDKALSLEKVGCFCMAAFSLL